MTPDDNTFAFPSLKATERKQKEHFTIFSCLEIVQHLKEKTKTMNSKVPFYQNYISNNMPPNSHSGFV